MTTHSSPVREAAAEGAAGHTDALRPAPSGRTGALQTVAGVRGSLRRPNASRDRTPGAPTSCEAGRTDEGNAADEPNTAAAGGKVRRHGPGAVLGRGTGALPRAAGQERGEAR